MIDPSEDMIAAGMRALEDGYYASWSPDSSAGLSPEDAWRMVVDVWRVMFREWLIGGADV